MYVAPPLGIEAFVQNILWEYIQSEKNLYTAKLLFHQSLTRHSDCHCPVIVQSLNRHSDYTGTGQ